jgi:hypothetical protein
MKNTMIRGKNKAALAATMALMLAACGGSQEAANPPPPQAQDMHEASNATMHFVHPGVLVNSAQLAYVKKQVAAKAAPFYAAYQAAESSKWGALDYKLQGPPSDGVIDCGSFSNPDIGCSEEDNDSTAAYVQALLWIISGNSKYAENAVAIMNAYAQKLRSHTNSNGPLQSAWTSEKWPAAADVIASTYNGWSAADIAAFKKMLTTQYLPNINALQGKGKNGNWELSMIDGMMGIAVFTEDQTLYNNAVALWKQWVPAYFYNEAEDGGKPLTFSGGPSSGGSPGWNGQTVFDAATSGVGQETCRDLAHTGLGLAATINAAETAYIQGTDLYTPMQARLTTTLEYYSRMLQGVRATAQTGSPSVAVPSSFPGLCTTTHTYIPVLTGTTERAYNAYHNRMGVALPQTEKHILDDVRPHAPPTNSHNIVFETLTDGGSPAAQ